jgi:hypothetical protein
MQKINKENNMKLITDETESYNYGEEVACDGCNEGEGSMGGCLTGSYAMCGDCCKKYGYDKPDYEYADEINEIFDKEKTFRENVLDYRERTYGSRDLILSITPISR